MTRAGLSQDIKDKATAMANEGMTRREIADRLGVDIKKMHNFFMNNKRKLAENAPKQAKVKIQKLEIKEEKEDTKPQAKSEKTMVIITSDINMLKKLIGEL